MIKIQWKIIGLITVMLVCPIIDFTSCDELLMGGHLNNQDIESKSLYDRNNYDNDNDGSSSSSSPYQLHKLVGASPFAFNGGKPFSLEKDPVTGQIDFDNAPPFKALNYTGLNDSAAVINNNNNNNNDNDNNNKDNHNDKLILDKNKIVSVIYEKNENGTFNLSDSRISDDDHEQTPNEINPYTPSFHDFLNLPIRYSDHEKYTSDKYPLISNSYANTKVQGNPGSHHAYVINNHKNYQFNYPEKSSTLLKPSYTSTQKLFVSKPVATITSTTTTIPPLTTTTMRNPTTIATPKPTTRRSTTPRTTTTKKVPSSTQPITTWKPSRPNERYSESYESDAMLPIEQMQSIAIKLDTHPHESFERVDYIDGYEDYEIEEKSSSTSLADTVTMTVESSTPASTISKTIIQDVPLSSSNSSRSNITEDISLSIKESLLPSTVIQSSNNVMLRNKDSFITGNVQNVGSSYYALGSAMPESLYGENAKTMSHINHDVFQQDLSIGRPAVEAALPYPSRIELPVQQKWWFNSEQSEKSQSLAQKSKDDRVNVMAGYRIVFPTSDNPSSATNQPSTSSIPTTVETSLPEKEKSSLLSEILTPPAVNNIQQPDQTGQRLHYYQPHHHHRHHNQKPVEIPSRVQRLPMNTNNFKIRNSDGQKEQQQQQQQQLHQSNTILPNILPQFRPNVKTPQRRGGETIGTMIIQNSQKNPSQRIQVRPPLPPAHKLSPSRRPQFVSHFQRLNPPPLPSLPIHKLRLPTPAALVSDSRGQSSENIQIIQKEYQPVINLDIQIDERTRTGPPINSIYNSRLNDDNNNSDVVTENSNDSSASPAGPPVFMKRKLRDNTQIATLQMIQQHKIEPENNDFTRKITTDEKLQGDQPESDRRVDESPVYVVYPVKGALGIQSDTIHSDDKDINESVVIGTLGAQRPLPPQTLSHENADNDKISQSLPFRHVSDFPYPLARPDPSMLIGSVKEKPLLIPNEHNNNNSNNYNNDNNDDHHTDTEQAEEEHSVLKDQKEEDSNINIIPYLQDNSSFSTKYNTISTTLHLAPKIVSPLSASLASTETSIAYVYTPTTRSSVHILNETYERSPVLLPSQQPSSSSSSAPSSQNFMAPFFASLSAEVPTKNGWNVVTSLSGINKESDVDRDSHPELNQDTGNVTILPNVLGDRIDGEKSQTEANDFNAENFKPELFSGFQPIFDFSSDIFDHSGNEKTDKNIELIGKLRTKESKS